MRSFAYWPVLVLLVLAAGLIALVQARPTVRLQLQDLTRDQHRWSGRQIQVSGLVSRFHHVPGHGADQDDHRWAFMLVDPARGATKEAVWVVLASRDHEPAPSLCDGEKVVITGTCGPSGCVFSRPDLIRRGD